MDFEKIMEEIAYEKENAVKVLYTAPELSIKI